MKKVRLLVSTALLAAVLPAGIAAAQTAVTATTISMFVRGQARSIR